MQTLALVDRCFFREGAILFGNKKLEDHDCGFIDSSKTDEDVCLIDSFISSATRT